MLAVVVERPWPPPERPSRRRLRLAAGRRPGAAAAAAAAPAAVAAQRAAGPAGRISSGEKSDRCEPISSPGGGCTAHGSPRRPGYGTS